MFRLIKYSSPVHHDASFSNCSTEYDILPVVSETGTEEALIQYAKQHSLKVSKKTAETGDNWNAKVRLTETRDIRGDLVPVYLGWYKIDTSLLPVSIDCSGELTEDNVYDIVNNQAYGIYDRANIKGTEYVIMESWDYYHELPMLGYSLDQLKEVTGITDEIFEDEVFHCHECGEWDFNDDGYEYNYRVIECTLLGIGCGCYESHQKDSLSDFVNNHETPLQESVAEELDEDGKIEFVEQCVGGVTDSWRSHSYNGNDARVIAPEDVLKEYNDKHPEQKHVLVLNKSGQFQTYYSVYRVL